MTTVASRAGDDVRRDMATLPGEPRPTGDGRASSERTPGLVGCREAAATQIDADSPRPLARGTDQAVTLMRVGVDEPGCVAPHSRQRMTSPAG